MFQVLLFVVFAYCLIENFGYLWKIGRAYYSFQVETRHLSLLALSKSRIDELRQQKKIKQLIKLKQEGASYETLKEFSINGTISEERNGNSTQKERYEEIPLVGTFDQKCQAIIDFKRRNKKPSADSEEDSSTDNAE